MSYFANSNDKKTGAEISKISNVKRYREGQEWYPFTFKAIGHKEPSAETSNTDRPITGLSFVDDDEEAVIEVEDDDETKKSINGLKVDIESIKVMVNKLAKDKKEKGDAGLKLLEDKMKEIKATVNKLAEDKREKVDATLKIIEDKTKDIDINLEGKVNDIKEILNPIISTLGFAKDCIEAFGGDKKLLEELKNYRRNAMLEAMVEKLNLLENFQQ